MFSKCACIDFRRLFFTGLIFFHVAANGRLGAEAVDTGDSPQFTPPPFEVPEGFTVDLVAGPPLVKYPMMAAFDERGRLFIAESDGQNLGKDELLAQQPRFVRMLEDVDADGTFDRSTIFADKMVMPEGALWHDGSFYILSAPYLWRLDDLDGDGVADRRKPLVGRMDLIGNANQHGPYLAPDGRLFFSGGTFGYDLVGTDGKRAIKGNWAGVFSCRTDGSDVRIECHAGINPVEVVFTEEGDMLGTCAIFDRVGGRCDALVHWVHGGTYAEPLKVPTLKQSGHYLPAARRWGQVAPAGLVRYRGTHLGDDFRGDLLACHFNTHEVVRIRLNREGATWRGTDEAFLRSTSVDFHPADVLEDADGSVLVIDTGGWLTMGCPTSRVGETDVYGGIYRVRRVTGAMVSDPRGLKLTWSNATPAELAARLDDARPAVRDRAVESLVRRGDEMLPVLESSLQPPSGARLRRNAAWVLGRLGSPAARSLLRRALTDADPGVRQAAAHSLGTLRDADAVECLMKLVVEDELPIRREAATALGLIGEPRAVPALFASLRSARDEFLEHALIYALIEIQNPVLTRQGLTDSSPQVQRAALLSLDQMEEGRLTRDEVAPLLATGNAELQGAALAVIGKHANWGDEIAALLGEALRAARPTPAQQALIAGGVAAFSQNETVQSIVAQNLGSSATSATRIGLLEAIADADVEPLPPAWVAPLSTLLGDPDGQVKRQAVATIARFNVEPFEAALLSMARDATQPNSLRIAALAAAIRRDTSIEDVDFDFLIRQLQTDIAPLERLTAANALGRAALSNKQLAALPTRLESAGPLELPALLQTLENAARTHELAHEHLRDLGLSSLEALAKSPGLTALPAARLQAVVSLYPPEVAKSLNRLLPRLAAENEEQRSRIAEFEAQVAQGDPDLGRQVFLSHRAACSVCHRIAGEGGQVGPELTRIGQARSTRDLVEAILFPSATLANGFESYTVITQSGRTHTGLIRRETADAIHLVTMEGVDVRVRRSEIEELTTSGVSVMPQGLETVLTPEELLHVVAYLKSLR